MKKRIFHLLLACAMLVSILIGQVMAANEEKEPRKIAEIVASLKSAPPQEETGIEAVPPSISMNPADPEMGALPFEDINSGAWYEADVEYVYGRGLINGVTETEFGPDTTTSRGMLATILYRLEGEPAVSGDSRFSDVPADSYYADAIAWASDNGIVTGLEGGGFAPKASITRQELATILFRYAEYKGFDVRDRAELSGFQDVGEVSTYAVEPLAWANKAGLVNGVTEDTLQPKGEAKRSEVAAILQRFCETVAEAN